MYKDCPFQRFRDSEIPPDTVSSFISSLKYFFIIKSNQILHTQYIIIKYIHTYISLTTRKLRTTFPASSALPLATGGRALRSSFKASLPQWEKVRNPSNVETRWQLHCWKKTKHLFLACFGCNHLYPTLSVSVSVFRIMPWMSLQSHSNNHPCDCSGGPLPDVHRAYLAHQLLEQRCLGVCPECRSFQNTMTKIDKTPWQIR